MRVAHLTTVDSTLEYLLKPQLQEVINRGGEVIGISAPGRCVAALEASGVRHIPLPSSTRGMSLRADLGAALELWRVLRREKVDVLHTHNPKPGLYGRVLGRMARVPVVVNTNHGLYATSSDRWSKRVLVLMLEALAARCSHAELLQNPEDLAWLTHWRLVRRRRTHLLGNGINLERFNLARVRSDRAEVRRELGLNDEHVVVGIVARLVAEKGYPELIAAMERQAPNVVLVAVGPQDQEKADALSPLLIERARRRGARFLGERNDVERLYRAMDLFVLPSHREGFPRAAMEAAAMGLPIIASDVRGCREVVLHRVNGLLVPMGDEHGLAEAIAALAGDANLRRCMGAASCGLASASFDERRVVSTVMDVYDALLETHR